MVPKEILQNLDCLKIFNEEQLDLISSISQRSTYQKGEIIQKEGDTCQSLNIVNKGRVAIRITTAYHEKIEINIVEKGNLFGWSAVVPPHTLTATSVCLEEVEVVEIPRLPLLKIFKVDAELKASFMETIAQVIRGRLKETREQMGYLLSRRA